MIDSTGSQQYVVCGVASFCRADNLFQDETDFVAGPVTQPILNPIEYGPGVLGNFSVFLQKLLHDLYRALAELFSLALALPACQFRRDLILRLRDELSALSLEEEIVFGQRTKDCGLRFGRRFSEKQFGKLGRLHFALFASE